MQVNRSTEWIEHFLFYCGKSQEDAFMKKKLNLVQAQFFISFILFNFLDNIVFKSVLLLFFLKKIVLDRLIWMQAFCFPLITHGWWC